MSEANSSRIVSLQIGDSGAGFKLLRRCPPAKVRLHIVLRCHGCGSEGAVPPNMSLIARITAWFASLLGIAAAVTASFLWLDRPIAMFVHDYVRYAHREVVDETFAFSQSADFASDHIIGIFGTADDSWSFLIAASGQYVRLQLGRHLHGTNKESAQVYVWSHVAGNLGGQ